MALINCPECGKGISDQSDFCINCGYILHKTKKNKKKSKIVLSIVLIFTILACAALVFCFFLVPFIKYNQAISFLNSGSYDEAISIFSHMNGYLDSNTYIQEAYYKKGHKAYLDHDYVLAIDYYGKSNGYEDSESKIESVKLDMKKELLKKAISRCMKSSSVLSSDGLSLFIDSENEFDYRGLEDILSVIDVLGLPDSLADEMGRTSALMGLQVENYNGFEISWTYHPDDGLDVLFKIEK